MLPATFRVLWGVLVPFACSTAETGTAPSAIDTGSTNDPDATVTTRDCPLALRDVAFTNEERITIRGYDLDVMEVDLSADGRLLMWNDNDSSGPENKNLHWASRVTDTTFQYEGEVAELNTAAVDGTPSFDRNGVLYYTSTVDYATNGFKSFYRATRNTDDVYVPELLQGLYAGPGFVSVDPDISADGVYLFYSLFTVGQRNGLPEQIDLRGAKVDESGGFQPLPNAHLANVNTDRLEYAPTISEDGKELYFTRADPVAGAILGIYRSVRTHVNEPFPAAETPVAAITGVVEAPAFNDDETALYYHRKDHPSAGVFRAYRVTRRFPMACR